LFSYELLRENGRPNHRTFYAKVANATIVDERTIRFEIGPEIDREMPLILGLMPILSEAATDLETFSDGGLTPLLGSGPYTIADVDPGASITYQRNPDYWADGLSVVRGTNNFAEIRYDYYRDGNTMLEAFKRGLYDIRPEDNPTRWATQFDFPAVRNGEILREELDVGVPRGMTALVFNTRRPIFSDPRVRRALIELFDFAWLNRTLYHELYARTASFYEASELSARGRPADAREQELLAPWLDYVKPDVMDGSFTLPETDGSGRDRAGLRRATALLNEAGYRAVDGRLVSDETGEPVEIEFLAATPEQERLALAYRQLLERVGIALDVRLVDSAQYQRRQTDYDFDIVQNHWFASLSPGNEQLFYWGSDAARTEGTRNYPGIENPAVDAMIEAMLAAHTREDFVAAVRALDRVLISGDYVIPLFHLPRQWVAHTARVSRPETTSLFGYISETWWETP
ncbi:MAG: extracellular solute-binding protein, partial [Pseudomonadota bacterium]